MSALSDLQKKLEKESQGIMFPFSATTSTVDTTQQVYNSTTDGIMNMQGKKYVGPDSVIQYGAEGQRNLKQIEAPMLPQFDAKQFPKAGEGIVETPTPVLPPTTGPVQPFEPDQPAVDPCPPGFKLIDGVCKPIEQPKEDRPDEIKPPRLPNKFESSLNGYLRHEEIKQAIDGSNYDASLNPERLQGGGVEGGLNLTTGKLEPGGTAGYVMGTAGSNATLGITNEQKTFNIDVTKEMKTANMDAAIGTIFGSILGGGAGSLIGGLLRKNYENTLIGQLNGLADFGIIEKPVDGFKIDTEGGVLGVGGKSFVNGIKTTNVAKNRIRQLISQATPEYNKEVRQQLGKEYLDKTKDYQKALFSAGNRSLMEGVSDEERARDYADRDTQGGFGGFKAFKEAKEGKISQAEKNRQQAAAFKAAKARADEYAKKDKLAVDNSWKDNYNWSGPNNTGEMIDEKDQKGATGSSGKNRGSGSGTGKSRVICTELYSTKELSTKDWIRDTQFTFKHLSKTHVKGYLAWAIPTVKHIQKYKLYRKVWKHIAQHRANDIAWRMKQGKFDLLGRIYAGIGEPLCWIIGNFVSDYNLNKLGVNKQWQKQ
tara:strand:+ start:41 stop:1825 length:1785 start_codon:yes stop_codon:yes gene_type:complete